MGRSRVRGRGHLIIDDDQPLVTIPAVEDRQEVTHYFMPGAERNAIVPSSATEAIALAGAWSDLDWDAMERALDEIRHANPPSPPIYELVDL